MSILRQGPTNSLRNPLRDSASRLYADGIGRLRHTIRESGPRSPIPSNGPYLGQCLASYPAEILPPAGTYYPRGSTNQRMPWCLVRIDELHGMHPNPANYWPEMMDAYLAGAPLSEFEEKDAQRAYMFFSSIRAMNTNGLCFPRDLDSSAQIPGVGEYVSVTFSDARTFRDGRYELIGSGDPLRTRATWRRAQDEPANLPLDLELPTDDPIGGEVTNEPIRQASYTAASEKYPPPFGPSVSFEMHSQWGVPRGGGHHNGLDLVVFPGSNYETAAQAGLAPTGEGHVITGGGLGAPIITIGRAKITSVRCCDSHDRFPFGNGIQSFSRCTTGAGGAMGKILTRDNLEEYGRIERDGENYSRHPISRIAFGTLGSSPERDSSIRNLQDYIANTPENMITVSRDDPRDIRSAGSISGISGDHQTGEMYIMREIDRRPRCESNVGTYSTLPYGNVYFFTLNHASRTGTMVEYELLEGPLANMRHTVRCMHMGAVSPALLAAYVEARHQGADLEVPMGTEIGLLGSHAVVDSVPHLHMDFGTRANASNATRNVLDPGCFIELGGSDDYWCCSVHRSGRSSSHRCSDLSTDGPCYGVGGQSSPMCSDGSVAGQGRSAGTPEAS